MADKKAATAAKRRYNNKVYSQVRVELPKDLVARFKEECKQCGVSQASVFKKAMEDFIAED